uniref:Potassium channel domain-containing protein n=1 Tax=viral metagenome TaxID=1070528 RepID=A0A6C0HZ79_9ZZZZ
MKRVLQTLLFHLTSIIVFGILYFYLSREHFILNDNKAPDFMDVVMMAVTIQAGVGVTNMTPISNLAKLAVTFQQLILICTNVFMIYFILIVNKEKFILSRFLNVVRGLE